MRTFIFIFFAGVCALHIQSSHAGVKEEIDAMVKAGTTSTVLKKINSDLAKVPLTSAPTSATFNCASIESVVLNTVPVNDQLDHLKNYISDVLDKALRPKLNSFYNSVNQFSKMMSTLKSAMAHNKKCCELYQTTQKHFLDSVQSNQAKLQQSLVKIQPFESGLLHHFVNLPKVATILKLTVENYATEITAVMAKIDEINSLTPKDKSKLTATLNAIMDTFARDDAKVIKALNDDVVKAVNEKCPNIKSFYDGLK